MLGFNDTSTLVGLFVESPKKRKKRDRRDSRVDERKGLGKKRTMKEREGSEEITIFPLNPYLLQGQKVLPNCKPISVRCPGDKSYTSPNHPSRLSQYDIAICEVSWIYSIWLNIFSITLHGFLAKGKFQNQSSKSCLCCLWHIVSIWFLSHLWHFMNIFHMV